MNKYYLLPLLLTAVMMMPIAVSNAQSVTVAELTVQAGEYDRRHVPVSAPLAGVALARPETELRLFETTDGSETAVVSQLKAGNPVQLTWILSGETTAGSARTFELRRVSAAGAENESSEAVSVNDNGDALEITIGDKPVLNYRYTAMPLPEGVSETYSRGGFIHPLWTPGGEVVTRIQPQDHYHHYGVWGPWTQVSYRDRQDTYDFWNIGNSNPNYRQRATTRSEGVLERVSGDVFGGFRAELNYVVRDLPHNVSMEDEVALIEQVEVNVWNSDPENDVWLVDYTSTYSPATEYDFTVTAYRYQGFSMRATEKWNDENATLLTSEGYDKSNGNGTRARWMDVNGISDTPEGQSGVLFITNPGNYNYPEQIRIWPTGQPPTDQNVFVNFNPAQEQDFHMEAGSTHVLRYRMMLYDGELDVAEAERYWRDFANPPKVEVTPVAGR